MPRLLGISVSERVLDCVALAAVIALGGLLSTSVDNAIEDTAIIVGVMLFKKLVKWAIIAAIVFFVVLPYLNNSGALESISG